MKKNIFIHLIVLTLTTSAVATEISNPSVNCDLPICDVSAKIEELRQVAEGPRFEYYTNLFESTKNIYDLKSLKNILEFGNAAYALSKEVDTEKYMFNLASQFVNRSIERLMTQPPLESQTLIQYYKGFIGDSQTSSFSALTFWMNQLQESKISSYNELTELIVFAKNARLISIDLKHEDFVINLATQMISLASNRLLRIDPYIEGIYHIKASCQNLQESLCTQFTTVTILITDDQHGISVSFSTENTTAPGFTFTNAEFFDGRLQNSIDNYDHQNVVFNLVVDPKTKEISGEISTSNILSDIQFSGVKKIGNDPLYSNLGIDMTIPMINELFGAFKGTLNLPSNSAFPVTMILRKMNQNIVATLQGDNLKLEFGSGYYMPSKGIMTMISSTNGMLVKLTLKVSNINGKLVLKGSGIGLSTAITYGIEVLKL